MLSSISVEILTISNCERWRETLNEIGAYDFYHLPAFHRLAEMQGECEAVMPVFRRDRYVMAFPMLLRNMPESAQVGSALKDATSINGFAGPVVSTVNLPEEIRQDFQRMLHDFFAQNHIVTAYSRLHPLRSSNLLGDGFGELRKIGVLLSIDLSLPPEAQWQNLRRDHRKDIRRLQKKNYICEEGSLRDLDEVIAIYHDTMRRVKADAAFLYDKAYFEYLLTEMPDVMHLFLCRLNGTIATFMIFSHCAGIVSPYISGTAKGFVEDSPSRILYDALRIWGNENGARRIHLGGGVGGQRDQLYHFKRGLATDEHAYQTWRYVVDQKVYDEICRNICNDESSELRTSYFPAYRDPAQQISHAASAEHTNISSGR
ncbi:MAG: GNAT family N-acetyltransferase [Armatimonadetes bacterium]|nr:GNAT family N-acetyltransferase [Armatimonadota bacterium]